MYMSSKNERVRIGNDPEWFTKSLFKFRTKLECGTYDWEIFEMSNQWAWYLKILHPDLFEFSFFSTRGPEDFLI